MFSFLSWNILSLDGIQVSILIEGTGLGVEFYASPILLANIRIWEKSEVFIHHHINEAGQTLFGFTSMEEKKLFRELLKVNGVGGKTALNLLGLGGENLMRAIQLEDDKLLSSVPGIGKKTAQKIIVDLKWSIDFTKHSSTNSKQKNTSDMTLVSSLVQMGYDKTRVEEIVGDLDGTLSLEIRTIEAIKQLSK
jgi:holliday junction DNA helicase RuvA